MLLYLLITWKKNNHKLQDPIFDPQVLDGVIEWRMPSVGTSDL